MLSAQQKTALEKEKHEVLECGASFLKYLVQSLDLRVIGFHV